MKGELVVICFKKHHPFIKGLSCRRVKGFQWPGNVEPQLNGETIF